MTDHARHTAAIEPVTASPSRMGTAGAHRRSTGRLRSQAGGTRRSTRAVVLAVAVLTGVGGIAAAAVLPPGTNGPGLTTVGPVSATDGFPVWYKDKTGLRLENCISQADPLCPAIGALPDPAVPVSFPDNYPDEGFYSLANAPDHH